MPAPTAAIIDDFNRANEAPIGGNWTTPLDSGHHSLKLISNQVAVNGGASGTATAYWNAGNFGPDCEVGMTIPTIANGDLDLFARIQSPGGTNQYDGYFARMNITGDVWDLRSVLNDSSTIIMQGTWVFTAGEKIALQCIGDYISMWVYTAGAWQLLGGIHDTSYPSAGAIAIGCTSLTHRLDDVFAQTLSSVAIDVRTSSPVAGVIDNFNRANEDPVSGGGQWSVPWAATGALPNLKVVSNQLAASQASPGGDAYWNTQFPADQEIIITVPTKPGSNDNVSIIGRGKEPGSATADWYDLLMTVLSATADKWSFRRFANGVVAYQTDFFKELTAGDKIAFRIEGNFLSAWHFTSSAWTLLAYVYETGLTNAGYPGVRIQNTTARVDDFAAVATGDAATVTLALLPSADEQALVGSLGTEYLKFTPSVLEFLLADVGTEDFKLTASGVDTAQDVESNTESFKFTPSGVEPQFGLVEAATVPLKYVPSGTDLLAHEYTDIATEIFKFTITSHDCYAHITPEYEIELFKRWNMGTPFDRWEVGSLDKRWNAFIISVGFEIPC